MAIVVNLYGKADIKQIQRAEKQLAGMRKELSASGGAWSKFGSAMSGASDKMKSVGGSMTMGVTAPVIAGLALAVKGASDLGESMNKTNVVFGASATAIHAWSATSATAFGLSRQESEEAAGTFGNLFKTMGTSQGESAKMSRSMVELASDLASFNNIPITDALDKLRSGLVGEAEPMRALGVLLSEGAVKAEAYRMGIAKNGAELTEAQKVQARYSLILGQTADAQGDFARTSTGMANKSRIMAAQFKDLGASLGESVLPFATKAAAAISGVLGSFNKLSSGQKDAVVYLGLFAAALGPILYGGGKAIEVVSGMSRAYKTLKGFLGGATLAQEAMNRATAGSGKSGVAKSLLGGGGSSSSAAGSAAGVAKSGAWAAAGTVVGAAAAAALISQAPDIAVHLMGGYAKESVKAAKALAEAGAGSSKAGIQPAMVALQAKADLAAAAVAADAKVTATVNAAIARLGSQSAVQHGAQFKQTMLQMTQLRELAAKKIPLGNIDKEHTDAELRSARDQIATSLGITILQADGLMKTMFADWRPQDVLMPAINKAAAATEKRIAELRKQAARDIKMGGFNATQLLNEIAKITSAFSGMKDQARQAANAAANALYRKKGGSGGGRDKGGGFQMAAGGWVAPRPGGLAAVLAEGGEGEYVVPQSKVGRFAMAALAGGRGGSHDPITIQRHAPINIAIQWTTMAAPRAADKRALMAWLKPELERLWALDARSDL